MRSGSESDFSRLIRVAYPKSYREHRGAEIEGTLAEASQGGGGSMLRESAGILSHGLRMRMGIGAERFGGRLLSGAAPAGLAMAAALGLVFAVFGDWLPGTTVLASHPAPLRLTFGPFLTVGPVLYAVWILAAVVAWVQPRWQATAAWATLLATVVVRELGGVVGRPFSVDLLVLGLLGLPAALAPRPEARRGPLSAVIAGAGTLVILCMASIYQGRFRSTYFFFPVYVRWMLDYPPVIEYATAPMIAVAVGLAVAGRRLAAGRIALLTCPFLILPFAGRMALHIPQSPLTWAAMATAIPIVGVLASAWLADLRRPILAT